ncbi:MAG TPA: glutamate racemase [Candidatus Angelobacter sp.]|nr:glutamate racemase [Candidatus Angelobacter sp.]
MNLASSPVVGVFDSGFGGLTVLHELLNVLPGLDYLYFGDTARLPYGSKSAHTVAKYAISSIHFLQEQGAELLVIACNTATALALDEIRASTTVPVIGVVDPGAQRAAEISKTKKAAVIATEATVASHAYQKALAERGITATEKACPLLVPLVEEGWVEHPVTEQVAHIYLDDIFRDGARDADVLVLGCTHYPLIRPLLRRVAPPEVQIVDSAESTAHEVARQVKNSSPDKEGRLRCFATDSVEKFQRLGGRFLGRPLEHVELIDIEG